MSPFYVGLPGLLGRYFPFLHLSFLILFPLSLFFHRFSPRIYVWLSSSPFHWLFPRNVPPPSSLLSFFVLVLLSCLILVTPFLLSRVFLSFLTSHLSSFLFDRHLVFPLTFSSLSAGLSIPFLLLALCLLLSFCILLQPIRFLFPFAPNSCSPRTVSLFVLTPRYIARPPPYSCLLPLPHSVPFFSDRRFRSLSLCGGTPIFLIPAPFLSFFIGFPL